MILVAFKLTNQASEEEREKAVLHLLEHSLADIVVQNDLTEVDPENGRHAAALYSGNRLTKRVEKKADLIRSVERLVMERIKD